MEARGKKEEARKQVELFLRGNRQQAVQDGQIPVLHGLSVGYPVSA